MALHVKNAEELEAYGLNLKKGSSQAIPIIKEDVPEPKKERNVFPICQTCGKKTTGNNPPQYNGDKIDCEKCWKLKWKKE